AGAAAGAAAEVIAASFYGATFAWEATSRPCLLDLHLHLPAGSLTVLVGRVGAGKSSLLTALLGGAELPLLAGSCSRRSRHNHHCCSRQESQGRSHQQQQQQQECSHRQQQECHGVGAATALQRAVGDGAVGDGDGVGRGGGAGAATVVRSKLCCTTGSTEADTRGTARRARSRRRTSYAPQRPWIMASSVRDNVLLGLPLDEQRYWQVLHSCALLPDLALMPAGDMAPVGDNGCSLSGGQRARLGLARALYHAAARTAAGGGGGGGCGGYNHHHHHHHHEDTDDDHHDDCDDDDVLLLLDDVLASLDAACAAHLVRHALLPLTATAPAPTTAGAPIIAPLPQPPLLPQPEPLLLPSPAEPLPLQPHASSGTHCAGSGTASAWAAAAATTGAAPAGCRLRPRRAPTVVLVSHDERCIRAARQVVLLEAGRVLYAGPPDGYFASPHCLHGRQGRQKEEE
ncbi:hypothetical protein Agub_g12777, partial [Astrephomene gubernaculifera]